MTDRNIVRLGHPALRTPAQIVTSGTLDDAAFQRLIDEMIEIMREARGVGLAAPQLGLAHQLFVYDAVTERGVSASDLRVMINPMIEAEPGELVDDWEGCLSIPDLRGLVPRHPAVRVHAVDRNGEPVDFLAEGFEARVIQHEFDHLNGVVYLDRMRDLKSLAFGREWDQYLAESGGEAGPPGG